MKFISRDVVVAIIQSALVICVAVWSSTQVPRAATIPDLDSGAIHQLADLANCVPSVCEIALNRVATLPEGTHRLHRPALNVVADGAGRFFVRGGSDRQVVVFDAGGKQLGVIDIPVEGSRVVVRLVPMSGGPVMAWVGPSGLGFELRADLSQRAWPGPVPYLPTFVRQDRTMVVAEQIKTPDRVGFPIHFVSANGDVVRSFGSEIAEYRADLRLLLERVVAPSSDGLVWASPRGQYAIERWDPVLGRRVARTPVKSNWFVESANYRSDTATKPNAVIESIWEQAGLIWTLTRDGASDWKPTIKAEQSWAVKDYNAEHDWVLEAVSPLTGHVLASSRVPYALARVGTGPLLASYALTQAGGADGLVIWRPELRRKGRL